MNFRILIVIVLFGLYSCERGLPQEGVPNQVAEKNGHFLKQITDFHVAIPCDIELHDTITPQGGFVKYKTIAPDSFRILYGKTGFLDSVRMDFRCGFHPNYNFCCQYKDNLIFYQDAGGELEYATVFSLKKSDYITLYKYLIDVFCEDGFILLKDPSNANFNLLDIETKKLYTEVAPEFCCGSRFWERVKKCKFSNGEFSFQYIDYYGKTKKVNWKIER